MPALILLALWFHIFFGGDHVPTCPPLWPETKEVLSKNIEDVKTPKIKLEHGMYVWESGAILQSAT